MGLRLGTVRKLNGWKEGEERDVNESREANT
jgi:hypothetical protein